MCSLQKYIDLKQVGFTIMKTAYVIVAVLGFLSLLSCSVSSARNEKVIHPSKAWIIETRSGETGITGQRILDQVTDKILRTDDLICIEKKRKVIIGLEKYEELYVGFPAKEIDNLKGYYLLALRPLSQGRMCIESLSIEKKGENYFLKVQGNSEPKVEAWIYYSRNTNMREFSTARGKKVVAKQLFDTEKFRNQYVQSFSLGRKTILKKEIPINSAFLHEGKRMDIALQFFETLEAYFGAEGETSDIWDPNKLSQQVINSVKTEIQSGRSTNTEAVNLLIFFHCPELDLKIGEAKDIMKDIKRRYTLKRAGRYFPCTFGVKVLLSKKNQQNN